MLLKEKFKKKKTNYHITYSPLTHLRKIGGFPDGTSGKEPACQCRRHRRCGFDPWVGKIPWRRAWQPTPALLPGEPMDRGVCWATVHSIAESDITEVTYHAGRKATKK